MIYVWRRDPLYSQDGVKHYGTHQCWYVLSKGEKTKSWQGYAEKEPDSNKWFTLSKAERKLGMKLSDKVRDRLKAP